MEAFPGPPVLRLEIARYYAARGQRDEALEHLAYVLDRWSGADPDYRPAQEARALRDRLRGG
ncbi:MAG: hypothetical protein ACR2GQ_02370 [Gemmatimonadota bacterium]